MIIFWLVAVVALMAALALSARVVLGLPSRSAVAAARVLPDTSKANEAVSTTEAGREQLVALVPAAQVIVAGPPPVSANKILDGIGPGIVIDTSLAVVGVDDRRDAVHRELWIASKKALAAKKSG